MSTGCVVGRGGNSLYHNPAISVGVHHTHRLATHTNAHTHAIHTHTDSFISTVSTIHAHAISTVGDYYTHTVYDMNTGGQMSAPFTAL